MPPPVSDDDIERRAADDPDAPLASDAQLAGAQREYAGPFAPRMAKQLISLRIDPQVVEAYRATGPGWQRRMHEVLSAHAPVAHRAGAPLQDTASGITIGTLNDRVTQLEEILGSRKIRVDYRAKKRARQVDWSGIGREQSEAAAKRDAGRQRVTVDGAVVGSHHGKSPVLGAGKAKRGK
ncbi:MAG: BrnA antitoxin family protein [Gemmatimonas sp.]